MTIVLIVDRSAVCPLAFVGLVCLCPDEVKASESRMIKITDFFVGVLSCLLALRGTTGGCLFLIPITICFCYRWQGPFGNVNSAVLLKDEQFTLLCSFLR